MRVSRSLGVGLATAVATLAMSAESPAATTIGNNLA